MSLSINANRWFRRLRESWSSIGVILLLLGALFYGLMKTERWEYAMISVPDAKWKSKMESMGGERWELVTARRVVQADGVTNYEMILKRRR
jgi:hypothetical protein